MKTIKSILDNVNVEEVLKNDKYGIFEGASNQQVIEWTSSSELVVMINNVSKCNSYKVSYSNTLNTYEINNENVIVLFRELYKLTSNNFVKSVLVSVGKNRKYTEKQLSVICEEMIKFENLEINFKN